VIGEQTVSEGKRSSTVFSLVATNLIRQGGFQGERLAAEHWTKHHKEMRGTVATLECTRLSSSFLFTKDKVSEPGHRHGQVVD